MLNDCENLKAPFPWFGGKRRAAPLVWDRFGEVRNYVEPFFGSGAVLLCRPLPFDGAETVNDKDGFVANFWRAFASDPEAVALHADNPVNENDLHARHVWLVGQRDALQARLEGDPDYFDVRIAGYWVWGVSCWIGSGFCSGEGPWQSVEVEPGDRQLVHLGNQGQGVKRQRVHLGNQGHGVNRQRVHLGDQGHGVNRNRVHLSGQGQGVNRQCDLIDYMTALAERLRRVRVCCGDWLRVMGNTPLGVGKPCGIFLDPPYADTAGRDARLYRTDSLSVAHDVREWAIAHGDNPHYRIALCGYDGEHQMPDSWECVNGKATGHGYGSQKKGGYANRGRERIWFSPHCLRKKESHERPSQSGQEGHHPLFPEGTT